MPSELRVDNINSTTSPYDPVFSTTGGALSHRNMIINGAMQVNQRGTSDATNSNGFPVDRFRGRVAAMDQLVVGLSQESDGPVGFTKSVKLNVNTAESSLESDEYFRFEQAIEAQNLQHLNYGTSDAKTLTLSFWVKSNLTGTYTVDLYKADTTERNITRTYTINAQNTWEKKTLTFPGDTDSGATIANDNGTGFQLQWMLAAGSQWTTTDSTSWGNWANGRLAYGHTANWATTQNNNWYITGVQLELGDNATPFEHRSYADELHRSMRYFEQLMTSISNQDFLCSGFNYNASQPQGVIRFEVEKRATPTMGYTTGIAYQAPGQTSRTNVTPSFYVPSPKGVMLYAATSGLTAGQGVNLSNRDDGAGKVFANSEL